MLFQLKAFRTKGEWPGSASQGGPHLGATVHPSVFGARRVPVGGAPMSVDNIVWGLESS